MNALYGKLTLHVGHTIECLNEDSKVAIRCRDCQNDIFSSEFGEDDDEALDGEITGLIRDLLRSWNDTPCGCDTGCGACPVVDGDTLEDLSSRITTNVRVFTRPRR